MDVLVRAASTSIRSVSSGSPSMANPHQFEFNPAATDVIRILLAKTISFYSEKVYVLELMQ